MIRALLLREWPALSYLFGLHPWDVERLNVLELTEYREQAQQLMKGRDG